MDKILHYFNCINSSRSADRQPSDMDFDLANKHKKEVEQRRREAKRKLEEKKKEEEIRASLEQEQRDRELRRLQQAEEDRKRAEAERQLNEGIRYCMRLRPYPSSRTDDKLELPPSALEDLERQGALEKGTLLTFAVSLPDHPAARLAGAAPASGSTHAGVAEFTAEEGTVGVPPRVALCLTKGAGLQTLDAVAQVEVRYVKLPRCSKSLVKLQPRGEGFHAGSMKVVSLDLEHVLLETLRGHTALSQGDWLPIRHQGQTYDLLVGITVSKAYRLWEHEPFGTRSQPRAASVKRATHAATAMRTAKAAREMAPRRADDAQIPRHWVPDVFPVM
eukprot:s173_g8.t2